jgi:hypothetical protein
MPFYKLKNSETTKKLERFENVASWVGKKSSELILNN